jgi:formylglycine-generating enzyme required for sulfatase activity
MKITLILSITVLLFTASIASADTFGSGANQFNIDFVPISGDASSANGTFIGDGKPEGFADPGKDYRIGKYEITNNQWNKFKASYGTVTGSPSGAYDNAPYWTGTNEPTNDLSWYEAAQFVNWLNTSTGHQVAYKFTGTIHTSNYSLAVWDAGDADGTNLYRNKNAFYFLPTENEWVKAAYWNGTALQNYATKDGSKPGAGSYSNYLQPSPYNGPWNVGSGSQELNGTYDMMGNVREWMESPYNPGGYSDRYCGIRGGSFGFDDHILSLSHRGGYDPIIEYYSNGFRIASIPEPTTLSLLSLGAFLVAKRRKA